MVAAIEAVDLNAPWSEIRERLRLVLPRRRPMPPETGDLVERMWPPGLRVGLGLDVGPAMLFVGREQTDMWGVSVDTAYQQAQSNVYERLGAMSRLALLREHIAGTRTIAFQSGEGWASSLLLMPHELGEVLGERAGLILAPMRDLVLWLPADTDLVLAEWILDEFAEADMNALDVPVLTLTAGHLEIAAAESFASAGGMRMN